MTVVIEGERITAIDPGPEQSGFIILQKETPLNVLAAGDVSNTIVQNFLQGMSVDLGDINMSRWMSLSVSMCADCIIEDIVFQGQMVGKSVFETAKKIGDYRTAWEMSRQKNAILIPRNDVLNVLCGSSHFRESSTGRLKKITDATVKRAIMAKFPETGGGSKPQIGTKKQPGPLYIMKGLKHAWSALGLAITYAETARL